MVPSKVTAIFDLPGVRKEDMHVSFQVDRLVVTWKTTKVTETFDGSRVLIDREEKKYSRTLPLPQGTKVGRSSLVIDFVGILLRATHCNFYSLKKYKPPETTGALCSRILTCGRCEPSLDESQDSE